MINHFYYAESDGCFKQEKWKVFWYGMQDFAAIELCVDHCRTRPATLADGPLRAMDTEALA